MADGIHPRLAAQLCSAVAEDLASEPGSYLLQTSTHTCKFLAAVDFRPAETRRRRRVWVGEGPPRNRYGRAARPMSSSGGGEMLFMHCAALSRQDPTDAVLSAWVGEGTPLLLSQSFCRGDVRPLPATSSRAQLAPASFAPSGSPALLERAGAGCVRLGCLCFLPLHSVLTRSGA